MMKRAYFKILVLIPLVIWAACDKNNDVDPTPSGPALRILDTALVFSVDSCCVLAPNIFTPNGDGINDIFIISGQNIDTINIDIRNAAGVSVFVNSNPMVGWDGQDLSGSVITGFYTYTFYCRSTSGVELTKTNKVFLCKDIGTDCFSPAVPPHPSDMVDFSQCGFNWATSEMFCFQ